MVVDYLRIKNGFSRWNTTKSLLNEDLFNRSNADLARWLVFRDCSITISVEDNQQPNQINLTITTTYKHLWNGKMYAQNTVMFKLTGL